MRHLKRFLKKHWQLVAVDSAGGILIIFLVAFAVSYFFQSSTLKLELRSANTQKAKLTASLADAQDKYVALKN